MPEDVQKKILDGEISMGHARVLSKMNDEDEVTDLANKVIEDNISVHELEEISKKKKLKECLLLEEKWILIIFILKMN